MSEEICPNINSCRMVSTAVVVPDEEEKNAYIKTWCKNTEGKWEECKRFITKASLGFCPDFVMPDTDLSIDEIIDKFEEDN
ncbi:MAG: hypothetical protein V2I47_05275 [Bacteroidales bacterium]|nr:hypothetical protein [Bacteroidales bacterium]